jgi:hypothetical protein
MNTQIDAPYSPLCDYCDKNAAYVTVTAADPAYWPARLLGRYYRVDIRKNTPPEIPVSRLCTRHKERA